MHKTIRKIFDTKICERLESMNILLVGAGGIGSEFLKSIITIGCKNIDIIDIDTIDITNLNRQFLFKKKDVKKHKSIVAKERALKHRKDLNINAYTFDVCTMKGSDISKYDYVINALDNIKARKYVNKLCITEKKVLIEAGSTGYNGQVYPIFSSETKCYNCEEKPKNKTYAICTIRQTPSLPEHCVAWGKLIFETFFCKNDNETLIDIKKHIEEESKKRNMDKEEIIRFIFNYLFHDTINELISLKKDYAIMPKPILFEENLKQEPHNIEKLSQEMPNSNLKTNDNKLIDKIYENNSIQLSSQNIWNKEKCIEMYVSTFNKLYKYLNIKKTTEEYLIFDKDDDDCINFITCLSNLRMINFSIKQKSKFDIQSIAGNIIPAISSTNAIVAAFQAAQLVHVIEHFELLKEKETEQNGNKKKEISLRDSRAKHIWIKNVVNGNKIFSRGNIVNAENLETPNPNCYVCQQPVINIYIKNFNDITLNSFVKEICMNELSFLYPFLDNQDRNIFDYDTFLENDDDYMKSLSNSLHEWDIKHDDILTLTDAQDTKNQIEIHLKEDKSLESLYLISSKLTKKRKPKVTTIEERPTKSAKKMKFIPEDDIIIVEKMETNNDKKVEEIIIDNIENNEESVVVID
ncbi:SUMO-activating enzyme subunit 2, putative [Plasmodium berghei]|uniref:SUMO-activating enzyme subunit n=2 Tax=Plasmodium berghei TaxID=5821 RepID=A0A509AS92_PLABA|nr:SUMO-activating enzyme subunit 2, putative [Plasmodium berghei ANKA]CXJ26089.1 SUMO-activating enzyme subunit 2, putative [Plasmodium berghei]SCM26907.1 SUMO-activating enzyme subunit 2, putative [Plasmodium berghei]SCN28696.1 SUMO-activating enzyme subunit 2, putative [Plasmodium berghei]SCO62934.1 SUMO-activating enzyme subunit 2, putative [Plasmodium berghei]SCO64444.1 SUMO-activating enzyme subunit 2, putative [Plasmodium berghei]|eukprot:XP_034424342.1 SUMO-activating enzyme subunit 2, putative [Plasmodium berghei ANKA]